MDPYRFVGRNREMAPKGRRFVKNRKAITKICNIIMSLNNDKTYKLIIFYTIACVRVDSPPLAQLINQAMKNEVCWR